MKYTLGKALVGAALAVGLTAGTMTAKAADKAAEDVFRFGGVFTLSGPASFLGLFEEAAVRLAVETAGLPARVL